MITLVSGVGADGVVFVFVQLVHLFKTPLIFYDTRVGVKRSPRSYQMSLLSRWPEEVFHSDSQMMEAELDRIRNKKAFRPTAAPSILLNVRQGFGIARDTALHPGSRFNLHNVPQKKQAAAGLFGL